MSYTVLLVEDFEDLRTVLIHVFEKAGLRVFWGATGAEAMEFVRMATELDVIVADFNLPDGRGFVPQVKRTYPQIPVLVLSGDPHLAKSEVPEADEVLGKPLPLRELADVVQRLAARGQQSRIRRSS